MRITPDKQSTYIGTMRSACIGMVWYDTNAERRLANVIFGTPINHHTIFTRADSLPWLILDAFWPRANFIHVWMSDREVR